eukprot:TRINITY_DN9385_c0_g1_i5.p2 TRINITY_DN9385_c0_g1~~TRINITY_DN9385_c0_g1_i5.p2  ORF type:complete len:111 (-),score=13.95 TRINITY_DN9385_c0_g1_i5:56-388(-)
MGFDNTEPMICAAVFSAFIRFSVSPPPNGLENKLVSCNSFISSGSNCPINFGTTNASNRVNPIIRNIGLAMMSRTENPWLTSKYCNTIRFLRRKKKEERTNERNHLPFPN